MDLRVYIIFRIWHSMCYFLYWNVVWKCISSCLSMISDIPGKRNLYPVFSFVELWRCLSLYVTV